jgi:hypothetical protein
MLHRGLGRLVILGLVALSLAACGRNQPAPRDPAQAQAAENRQWLDARELAERRARGIPDAAPRETIWDLFRRGDAEVGMRVNRYLWTAALEVLNFLPPETVDPFTGVIATGFGTPPGGGRAYRATVLITDPALDARSLKLAMQARGGGPVSAEVHRQIEDAILTRARQLRVEGRQF